MQWVRRAGPSRIWVSFSPSPTSISRLRSGMRRPSNRSSQCPPCSSGPMIGMRRRMRQPGSSRWNRKAERPLRVVVRCARDQDEMRRLVRAGDEPFMAVDHPVVAVAPRRGAHHRGVGARARRRLGHDEGRAHHAIDDGLQPFALLRVGADFFEHLHVAVVGRGAVEGRPGRRSNGPSPRRARPCREKSGRGRPDGAASAAPTDPPASPRPGRPPARRGGCSRARRSSPGPPRSA